MLSIEEKEKIFFDSVISFEGQFDSDFLLRLIFGNARPNHVINDDILWSTKLHVAVISKDCNPAVVENILAEDISQLNQKNIFQVSPLHRAVYCGKNDVIIVLLQHGAYVNDVERSMMSSLHIAARNNNQYQYDILQTLIQYGGHVNCVDYRNQTPLHMLVKNRVVQEQSLYLLLENGANPDSLDKDKNSVLKVAMQNKYFSLNVIKTLLMFGANPDRHLKYCVHNLPLAKLLIQYLAIKKIETVFQILADGLFEWLPEHFVDLSFCSDITIYLELSAFRDNCINELMAMRKVKVNQNYNLFKFISENSSNGKIRFMNKNMSLLEDVLISLLYDQYSYCSDLIDAAFDYQDILNILSQQGVYANKSGNLAKRIYLNYYTISEVASYLTKKDLINLTLVYMRENKYLTKRMSYTSKSTKRVHEGLSDSMVCMKRLKL